MNFYKLFSNYSPIRQLLISAQNNMRFNRMQSQLTVNNSNNNNKEVCFDFGYLLSIICQLFVNYLYNY